MTEMGLPIRLLLLAHISAAIGVTIHALLNKRDVRAAVGWIGLAWLSPFMGCILYWLMGVNRVTRRALRLNRHAALYVIGEKITHKSATDLGVPEQIAIISSVGDRVTQRPVKGGNAILLLRDGDEAYPSMLEAIRGACKSIALASYIFRDDPVGNSFIDALATARARGIEVRVLLDGIGSGYIFSRAVRKLRARAIPVGRFLLDWLPWRMPLLNLRNHKKLLIVDGAIGFTGGLNIGAENVMSLHPDAPVHDVHFRIEGPAVEQLMTAFCVDWQFTTGETLIGNAWYPIIPPVSTAFARGISEGPDEDLDKLEIILLTALNQARTIIRIVTPYFLPNERLLSALSMAALRGVDVELILPQRSNKLVIDWAERAHLSGLLESGCKLFFDPQAFDHAKLMTVDGQWSLIGSANWDERSLRLNFEFNLEIYHAGLTANINQLINLKIARAELMSIDKLAARSLSVRLRDAAARLLMPYL